MVKGGQIVMEGWVKHHIGDNFVNISAYVAAGLAMVVGSLLKPILSPTPVDVQPNRGGRS
jgi:hypothetical protein